jgi:hypothetical protein
MKFYFTAEPLSRIRLLFATPSPSSLAAGRKNREKNVLECIKIDIFIKNILWFCFANTLQSAKDA